ncbi:MAG: RIP metalloprotease RseP [Rikenellaceae bacterium]
MEILIKTLQFILSLSLLVMIHEGGHFLFAKMFGIRVEKFYLFFNPKFSLFKYKHGETEYGIGWIPFGGYVKLSGMMDESMDKEQMKQPAKEYEFRSKPAWQRLLVMIGGVLMNIITAFVIYICMSFSYGESYIKNEDVKYGYEFSDLGQKIGFVNGDKILSVDGQTFDNYMKVREAIIISNPKEVLVERGGEKVVVPMDKKNIEPLLTDYVFQIRNTYVVDSTMVGSGAAVGGLMKGDSLVGINGVTMIFGDEFKTIFQSCKDSTLMIDVIRDSMGVKVAKSLPVKVSDEGMVGIFSDPIRGIAITEVDYNFFQSIGKGVDRTFGMVTSYVDQMKLVFTPSTGAYKQIGSVISMGSVFAPVWDWFRFWNMTALFSVILAVMNILPIPALDGGHVMFLIYEVVARRQPNEKFMEYMQVAGMVLLFALMAFALGNDIFRLLIK